MKEFEPIPFAKDNQVVAAEQRQVKTEQTLSSVAIYPGHTCWEFDLATGVLEPAKIEKVDYHPATGKKRLLLNGIKTATTRTKIIQRPDCLYVSALNRKNTIKKVAKLYDALVKAGAIIRPK